MGEIDSGKYSRINLNGTFVNCPAAADPGLQADFNEYESSAAVDDFICREIDTM
jgi:hypothetical protein